LRYAAAGLEGSGWSPAKPEARHTAPARKCALSASPERSADPDGPRRRRATRRRISGVERGHAEGVRRQGDFELHWSSVHRDTSLPTLADTGYQQPHNCLAHSATISILLAGSQSNAERAMPCPSLPIASSA
jgi:hypothetical protein